jgi:hypothetical protein
MASMNNLFQFKYYLAAVFIFSIAIALLGALFKLMHWPWADEMLLIALLITLILCFILLYDMMTFPIKKRPLWIFGLIISPLIVGLIYCFMRDDLLDKRDE